MMMTTPSPQLVARFDTPRQARHCLHRLQKRQLFRPELLVDLQDDQGVTQERKLPMKRKSGILEGTALGGLGGVVVGVVLSMLNNDVVMPVQLLTLGFGVTGAAMGGLASAMTRSSLWPGPAHPMKGARALLIRSTRQDDIAWARLAINRDGGVVQPA